MKIRCNSCMSVFNEEYVHINPAYDEEYCPCCGINGCLMDVPEDEFPQYYNSQPVEKIQTQTEFGALSAEIGGNPDYPEIFVYFEKESGVQIDLVAVSVSDIKEEIGVYLYCDTQSDDWTNKYTFSKEELDANYEEE